MNRFNSFIVTTASKVEGYRIIEQLGVVYGDAIHKPNFTAMTSSRDFSTAHSMFIGSAEMKGTERLVYEAREYAFGQMKRGAKELGANAIVGFICNNSIGNDIMHLSLYGTAVKVVSEAEYESQMVADANARAQEQAEKEKRVAEQKRQIEELQARKDAGDLWREEAFLKEIDGIDSVMQIWNIWSTSGLDECYADITRKIQIEKSSERMYGKIPGEAKNLKETIKVMLFGK